ncbi:MAG: type II secretion system protein GspG [Deltaproteobacteria bacterium]|nr:type II secretion system protein GspG [Deltaproteobacteria bacterium]
MKNRKLPLVIALVSLLAAGGIALWLHLRPGGVTDTHAWALTVLPEATPVVAALDAGAILDLYFDSLETVLGFRLDDAETRKEVGTFLESRLGLDPLAVREVVLFVVDGEPAFLLRGDDLGTLRGEATREYQGVTLTRVDGGLWAAAVGEALVLGDRDAVSACIDVSQGREKALADAPAGALHRDLANRLDGGLVLATVVLDEPMKKELHRELLPNSGVDAAGISIDRQLLRLAVRADDGTRKDLLKQFGELRTTARAAVTGKKEDLRSLDFPTALAMVLLDHHLDSLLEGLEPGEDGDCLVLDLDEQAVARAYLGAAALLGLQIVVPPAAKQDMARMQLQVLSHQLMMHYYRHDAFPESLEVLTREEEGQSAALSPDRLRDPWGNDVRYQVREEGFRLCSSGPDGDEGTDDDLCEEN